MPAWDRRYNISGQVLVGHQLDSWCGLLDKVLNTTIPAGAISHMTGGTSVSASSSIGFLASTGIDNHDFWAFKKTRRFGRLGQNWSKIRSCHGRKLVGI